MTVPTGESKYLQIHPTRRCNLRCLHCYSTSGPKEREELAPALLRSAISDAGGAGYNVASFSGGEPLLYPHLRELLEHARGGGLLTTVTTNGMLLDGPHLEVLAGATDLIAISLDGTPASHNRVRASPRAFDLMASRLGGLRATGIPFGFIFTLTQYNLDELAWVAGFALEQGARLLQIHPLEQAGRARWEMADERPDAIESAYAYIEAARIREVVGDSLVVQLDLLDREHMRANAGMLFADELAADALSGPFADLISPLVIEPDGTVSPVQHGFAREYALGELHTSPLRELMARWRVEQLARFRKLCRGVFEASALETGLPFFNWYEVLGEAASRTQDPTHLRAAPADEHGNGDKH